MKTATEVLAWMDGEIEQMQLRAAGPCIDALIEWADREAYREAMKRAHSLKAVERLRAKLTDLVEVSKPKRAATHRRPRRPRGQKIETV